MWQLTVLLITVILVCLQSTCEAQCPAVSNVNPKSGLKQQAFTITGSNLLQVTNITTSQGTVNYTKINSGQIKFQFLPVQPTGIITINLLPSDNVNCNSISFTIDIKGIAPLISTLSSTSGQPGTVIKANGCFPSTCGDNSTSYEVQVGGVNVEVLASQVVGVGYASNFFIRLVHVPSTILNAPISIISQYGTVFSITTDLINYELAGNVTSVIPSTGQKGTLVTIQGNNLIGLGALGIQITNVTFGGVAAEIISATQSKVAVRVASGAAGPGIIQLNSTQYSDENGAELPGPYNSVSGLWTQLTDGIITALVPPAGQAGQIVYICGTSLRGGGVTITNVSIAGVPAQIFSQTLVNISDPGLPPECLSAIIPNIDVALLPLKGSVNLTANTEAVVITQDSLLFEYANISSVNPNQGQEYTYVTIRGIQLLSGYNNLTMTPQVYLSGVQAIVHNYTQNKIIVQASPFNQTNVTNQLGDVEIKMTQYGLTFTVFLASGWSYLAPGEITSVDPPTGQYGTYINITGTNLLGYGTTLQLAIFLGSSTGNVVNDPIVTAEIKSFSDFVIILSVPRPANVNYTGFIDIHLIADNGAQVRGQGVFRYLEKGRIVSVSPSEGQRGTYVTISGLNLFGYGSNVTSVTFGDIEANIQYDVLTNSSILVRAGLLDVSADTPVSVTIISDTHARVESSRLIWTYLRIGEITSVIPNQGQIGSTVTINGVNLLGGGTNISNLYMDGVPATIQPGYTSTQITVRLGEETLRDSDFPANQIYIESNTGAFVTGGTFEQLSPGMITSFAPMFGRQGTKIVITGYNLTGFGQSITSVSIAGYNSISENLQTENGDTRLIVQVGPAPNGTSGQIRININTGAIIESTGVFTYTQPGFINTVTPSIGAEGVGILIQGSELQTGSFDITNVTIGGSGVSRIVTTSKDSVSVVVGPAPINMTNQTIRVISSDGSYVEGGSFTYQSLNVSVVGLNYGQHGTQITIKVPFPVEDVTRVLIGGSDATILSTNTISMTVVVSVPRARTIGGHTVDVTIENSDHIIARQTNGFTYLPEGSIYSVLPGEGQKGTRMSISGERLLGGGTNISSVTVGGASAYVEGFSDLNINMSVAANINAPLYPFSANIVIISNTGAIVTRYQGFSFVRPGQITAISPARGQYGTVVTIKGMDLLQGSLDVSSVLLAGVEAVILGTPNSTSIQVKAGPGSLVTNSVSVVLTSGAMISSNTLQFEYIAAGAITMVLPPSGTVGTIVNIYGTNLQGGGTHTSQVILDGVPASIVFDSNTHINVTAGLGNATGVPGQVIIISNTGSTVVLNSTWIYDELGNITSVSPSTGQQGVTVVIEGVSLIGSSGSHIIEVTLAGVPATILNQTNTSVQVAAGYSNVSRTGPVVVKEYSGPVITSLTNWSYYEARIDSIYPKSGVNGTYVTLNGTNLIGEPGSNNTVMSVRFGSINAFDVVTLSENSVRVRAGYSENTPAPVSVQITSNSGANLILQDQWYFQEPGRIDSIKPTTAFPGENVTIQGVSLVPQNATGVKVVIGQTQSFDAIIVDTTTIQFRVGAYQGLDVPNISLPIYIEANDGATVYNNSGLFTFNMVGNVSAVTPNAGGTGTEVAITGTNLLNGGSLRAVYLAEVKAEILNFTNSTIFVRAGAASDISGTVVIESDNGLLTGLSGAESWTYLPSLTASNVTPQSGRNGTKVIIDISSIPSTYLIRSVTLVGINATIVSISGGMLELTAGNYASSSPTGDTILYFQNDIILTIPSSWTYQTPVTITTNQNPLIGYYNTTISINGLSFQGVFSGNIVPVYSVTLAGFNTSIISQNDSLLTVRINDYFDSNGTGNITGPIIIIGQDGSIYTSSHQNVIFTYLQVSVTSVSPSNGQYGTLVSIKGIGLLAGGSSISSLRLAGILAANITSISDNEIKVRAAGSSNAIVPSDIVYIMDSGAHVTIATSWMYVSPGQIDAVTPSSGRKGTIVTITGTGMLGGGQEVSSVLLNGVSALEIMVSYDTFIRVRAGESGVTGAGNVTVIANTGAEVSSVVMDVSFQYLTPGEILSVSPSSGQFGTNVTITGIQLYSGSGIKQVILSQVEASLISFNETEVNVIAQRPSFISSLSGQVIVVSMDGTITESTQSFVYLQEGQIYSVLPYQGQHGANVIITGARLRGGGTHVTSATVCGIPAVIISESDSVVRLTIDENVDSNYVDVPGDIILTADTGAEVTRLNGWTYIQVGQIMSLSPLSGQYGTIITITGERLTAGGSSVSQVFIGDVPALDIISSNSSIVVFRAGNSLSSNTFNATITLISNHHSNLSTNSSWSYLERSDILAVQPSNATGGSIVIITGTSLLGGGTSIINVILAEIEVREIIMGNDTYIEVETGFNSDGQPKMGDVSIESDTGALTILSNGFVYESECPIGQHGNSTNSCSPCHPECDHCYGPSDYNCYDCKNFRILNGDLTQCVSKCPSVSKPNKECVDDCTTNQYRHISTLDNVTYCFNCSLLCDPNLSCSGSQPSQCTACNNVIEKGVCAIACSTGSYVVNSTCYPCHEQCLPTANCYGPEAYQCNVCANVSIARAGNETSFDECVPFCPSDFYVDNNNRCQLCHTECQGGCIGSLNTQCIACTDATIVHTNGTIECVSNCNPDSTLRTMYKDPFTGECQSCHQLCSLTAGCNGPFATDCILCKNFTGNNTMSSEFVPRFNEECLLVCPNNTYADLRTGTCESCDHSCTMGCDGPSSMDCFVEVTERPTTIPTSVGSFSAGAGTIALTIVVILIMLIAFTIVIIVLVVKLKRSVNSQKKYNFGQEGFSSHPIEMLKSTHTNMSVVDDNADNLSGDSITESRLIRSGGIRIGTSTLMPGDINVSKMNPTYLEVSNIELLEEDEASLSRSCEALNQKESLHSTSHFTESNLSASVVSQPPKRPPRYPNPYEDTTLPPIPPKSRKQSSPLPSPLELEVTQNPQTNPLAFLPDPGEIEPLALYMEAELPDQDISLATQEEYTDMELMQAHLPMSISAVPIFSKQREDSFVEQNLYEETDLQSPTFIDDITDEQEGHQPSISPSTDKPPDLPPRPGSSGRGPPLPPRPQPTKPVPYAKQVSRTSDTSMPGRTSSTGSAEDTTPGTIEEYYEEIDKSVQPTIKPRAR